MEIKTIIVNKGDTLSKIAKDNNTTVNEILKINKDITDPNLILVGQEIKVEEMDFSDQIDKFENSETTSDNVIRFGASGDPDTQVGINNSNNIEKMESSEVESNNVIRFGASGDPDTQIGIDNNETIQSIETNDNTEESSEVPQISEETSEEIESIDTEELDSVEEINEEEQEIEDTQEEPIEEIEVFDDSSANEEYVSNVQNIFDETQSRTGKNYTHRCGALVSDQLETLGIVDRDKASTPHGKDLAKVLANNDVTINGYSAVGYESNSNTQKQVFENIIDDNNGSLDNLVISFNTGGSFSNSSGHVVLIQKIEDNQVYFVDDFGVDSWNTKEFNACSMTIKQFEDTYLQSKNNANYMTHLK